ncbi:HDOD domain-containing protein [Oligoflexia bacterium]|nr:HDOD domain-containing protein [Oligoflexia bacterium]
MFKKLFGKDSAPKAEEAHRTLSLSVSRSIMGAVGAKGIPTMPGAAQKAFQLATDPNAEARDFIDVIESDESLSARVVKIANSVFFDRGKPSTSIEESVIVIGINELRCLLNATTLSEIFPSKHSARAQLWANDIATGLISRTLAQRFCQGKDDTAFLGGLMHDIGKLLLLQRVPADYSKILDLVRGGNHDFCQAEESVFPFDHTEAGLLIGEKWKFTKELLGIIRGHHNPWEEFSSTASLPALVKAADLIAHSLGLGHPRGFGKFQNSCEKLLAEAWEFLGIAPDERRGLLQNVKRTFDLEFELYSGQM